MNRGQSTTSFPPRSSRCTRNFESVRRMSWNWGKLREQEWDAAKKLSMLQLQDEQYRTELARLQQMFDQTIRQLQETSVFKNYSGITAQLISPPQLGERVKPKLSVVVTIAGIFGLFAAVALACFCDFTDKSVHSPEQIRSQLGLVVLGHIPVFALRERKSDGSQPGMPARICTWIAQGPEAEPFRALRNAMLLDTKGEGAQGDPNHEPRSQRWPNDRGLEPGGVCCTDRQEDASDRRRFPQSATPRGLCRHPRSWT